MTFVPPDPATTEWVPIWNPISEGPVGPAGPPGADAVLPPNLTYNNVDNIFTQIQSMPGIKFPATQVPSSDVNTLDDYEEGTWTPSLTGDGGASSGTVYTSRSGTYVKIGSFVTVWYDILLGAIGTIPGNVILSGLPFTSANINSGGFGIELAFWSTWVANFILVANSLLVNDSRAYLVAELSGSGVGIGGTVTSANIGSGGASLRGRITYKVP